jgi:hypothetical protein
LKKIAMLLNISCATYIEAKTSRLTEVLFSTPAQLENGRARSSTIRAKKIQVRCSSASQKWLQTGKKNITPMVQIVRESAVFCYVSCDSWLDFYKSFFEGSSKKKKKKKKIKKNKNNNNNNNNYNNITPMVRVCFFFFICITE